MPKQPFAIAAAAVVCLLITTGAGLAQQRYYPQQRYSPQTSATPPGSYQYQYQSPATLVGTYKSDTFHPGPLVLNISGMDSSGNLSGSMWGMETRPQNGEDPAWQYWQHVFGRDAPDCAHITRRGDESAADTSDARSGVFALCPF